jgi:plasmid replication initiation protein
MRERIRKPNVVVESKGVMTTFQHRMFAGMIHAAKKELEKSLYQKIDIANMNVFCVPFATICKYGGAGDKNLERVREELNNLVGLTCSYVSLFDKKPDVDVVGGFAFVSSYELKDGLIEYQLPFQISRRLIGDLSSYCYVDLINLAGLRSIYARYLYVLLSRVKDLRHLEMTVDRFRQYMGVENVHKKYGDLKKRVILPAIKGVREHTEIDVDDVNDGDEKNFRSKEVQKLKFTFKINQDRSLHFTAEQKTALGEAELRRKHVAKAKQLFDNLAIDPSFPHLVQAEIDRLKVAHPRLKSLSHSQKIALALESMGFIKPLYGSDEEGA